MILPDYPGLWKDPTTEIEKLLAAKIDAPDYITHVSLVYGRLRAIISQLESDRAVMMADRNLYFAQQRDRLTSQKDPKKNDAWISEAAAERKLQSNPILLEYKRKEIEFDRRIGILTAYSDALEMKNRMTPGEQGRLNSHMKLVARHHNER